MTSIDYDLDPDLADADETALARIADHLAEQNRRWMLGLAGLDGETQRRIADTLETLAAKADADAAWSAGFGSVDTTRARHRSDLAADRALHRLPLPVRWRLQRLLTGVLPMMWDEAA